MEQVRVVRSGALPRRPREESLRLPEVLASQPHLGARAARLPARPRRPLRDRRRSRCRSTPSSSRTAGAITERLEEARNETAEEDALVVMQGGDQDDPGGGGGVRIRLPRRLDGLGRRRALRARRAGVPGAAAALRLHHRERRRAHAGGAALAHADGEDLRRADPARARAAAVRLGADRSDDGRRVGELRHDRRRRDRRAGRADRLRRARA